MLILALLAVFFWSVVPGLITGWMRRERGRSFLPGLLLGTVLGPFGILTTLAFLYYAERTDARRRRHRRGRAVRVFYDVPVVGHLHVSTVWALAGLATFLCLWMVGGIGYEFYRASLVANEPQSPNVAKTVTNSASKSTESNSQANTPAPESKLAGSAQNNASLQTRTALLGNISAQPAQAASPARVENSSTQTYQPAQTETAKGAAVEQPVVNQATPIPSPSTEAAVPSRASAQTREAALSEVTQALSARGHKVHAALSGDTQTSTLSLSGATLTRDDGNQLLGTGRLRQTLKAAGVRIVVMVNGKESWTYIL